MKLNILYTINKYKENSKGLCYITCRLTYLKKRKQFSTRIFINPLFWNSKKQQVEPLEPDVNYINTQLSLIRQNLNLENYFILMVIKMKKQESLTRLKLPMNIK